LRGIQFIVDETGRKTAAVIDLEKHKALWEDIEDVLVSRARRHESASAGKGEVKNGDFS
jgi:hypothetical protein